MAGLLYRLGKFSSRRPWVVITTWIVILLAAGGAWLAGNGPLTSAITVPGTATEQVQDRLQTILGSEDQGSATIVVHTDDDSDLTDADASEVSGILADVAALQGVDSVVDPFTTTAQREDQAAQLAAASDQIASGRAQLDAAAQQLADAEAQARAAGAYDAAAAQFAEQAAQLQASRDELETNAATVEQGEALLELSEEIRSVSSDGTTAIASVTFDDPAAEVPDSVLADVRAQFDDADLPGLEIEYSTALAPAAEGSHGSAEAVGIVIAAIVLLIMLGTFVMAGLPLLNGLMGVGVSILAVLAFSGFVDMNDTTPVLALMLGLAVGIDYTLFIVNRHQRQLREGVEIRESIALANGTSGTAVVFAGATVVIALLALWVTGIPFLGLMGTAGAAAVLASVLIAVTLTPALLGLAGRRALSKRAWAKLGDSPSKASVEPTAIRKPRAVITAIGSVLALGIVALPALSMQLGLPDDSSEPQDSTQYQAFEIVNEKFGDGQNSPLVVVADLPAGLSDTDIADQQITIGEELQSQEGVLAVAPFATSDDNRVQLFQVIPTEGAQSLVTEQLVHDLRDLTMQDGEVTFSVAGAASGNIDISEKIADALPPYLVIVIGLSIVILVMVFRSILVPVIATAGFVLSLLASLGAVTAIYQFGWLGALFGVENPGPVLSILPTMLVGILFGLAMDYQLFIGSGIREAFVHGSSAQVAVAKGVRSGRAVVTAAAIIMAAVFGGFIFGDSSVVKALGFGLAFGVLVDAFIVRMLLIPALMTLLGRSAWWLPKWLERVLPNVDVEGASLERHVAHATPADRPVEPEPSRS